jgi:uncharacterized protein YqkB
MFKKVNLYIKIFNYYFFILSLTIKAKESEQLKQIQLNSNANIFSLLTNAQEKFQESVCFNFYFQYF